MVRMAVKCLCSFDIVCPDSPNGDEEAKENDSAVVVDALAKLKGGF